MLLCLTVFLTLSLLPCWFTFGSPSLVCLTESSFHSIFVFSHVLICVPLSSSSSCVCFLCLRHYIFYFHVLVSPLCHSCAGVPLSKLSGVILVLVWHCHSLQYSTRFGPQSTCITTRVPSLLKRCVFCILRMFSLYASNAFPVYFKCFLCMFGYICWACWYWVWGCSISIICN